MRAWFILVLTIAALFHLLAGLVWLMGYKSGKLCHYCGFIITALMTGAFINLSKKVTGDFELYYFYPLVLSLVMVVGVSLIKEKGE